MQHFICDPAEDPYEAAKTLLPVFLAELTAHGVSVGSVPQMVRSDGMLCAYDLRDGIIHLSFPEFEEPVGRLKSLFMRALVSCDGDDELREMIALFLPKLLAHELTHCLRHRLGLFGDDLWLEEQIANTIGHALTAHRYTPKDRQRLEFYLQRAAKGLAEQIESATDSVNTYHNSLAVFVVTGAVGNDVAKSLSGIATLFKTNVWAMLKDSGLESASAITSLAHRKDLIRDFNEDYTSDVRRYMHFQITWNLLDIQSGERHYLDEVTAKYLGQSRELIEPDHDLAPTSFEEVQALYRAAAALPRTTVAARFFYKRYRENLIDCIACDPDQVIAVGGVGERSHCVHSLLEDWSDEQTEPLRFLAASLSPQMCALLPQNIGKHLGVGKPGSGLILVSDRRLWDSLHPAKADDTVAARTWRLIEALDQIEIFRQLSSSRLLELIAFAFEVRFAPGETIVWQGENNQDVFLIIDGAVDVIQTQESGVDQILRSLTAGEVFGEMSFLTGEPRSATVCARSESRCLVIKGPDLHQLARRHAELPMAIARVLARRLGSR